METPPSTISRSSTPETPAPADTAVRQLDFDDERIDSVFVNLSDPPEDVDGFFQFKLKLKPEIAENIADDVDGILAYVDTLLVSRLQMSSQGVHHVGEDNEGREYVMSFKSTSNPSKTVDIRFPTVPDISIVSISVSNAFTSEEARDIIVHNVDKVISDIATPLQTGEDIESEADPVVDPEEDETAVLKGSNDKNLVFYEKIAPVFSLEDLAAKPLPINNTVYDQETSKDVMLQDFVMSGNKLVFLFNGKQVGISYAPFIKNIREGNSIFYECTRVFKFDPTNNELGTFEFNDVYARPYIEVSLTSRIYITLKDFKKLLNVPVHPYWEIKESGRTLNVTASRSSVVHGGPIQSQLHCQNGSDLKVYSIEPYIPTKEEEEEEVPEVSTIVTFQRGEERTPMDISQNANAADVKQAYATQQGIPPDSIQLVVQGKLLALNQVVVDRRTPAVVGLLEKDVTLVPGTTVTVVNARLPPPPEGARRTYRRRKNKRKTNKISAKYKNVR